MKKAVSPMLTVVVAVIVAIVGISIGIYTYLYYNQLVSGGTGGATVTTTAGPMQINLPYDNSSKTVFLYLVTTSGGGYTYNGTSFGKMKVYIPAGFSLSVKYTNYDSQPHNVVLIRNSTATPNNSDIKNFGTIIVVFGGSPSDYALNIVSGGGSISGTSPQLQAGYYMIVCGVPGHAQSGMWIDVIAGNYEQPYVVISS